MKIDKQDILFWVLFGVITITLAVVIITGKDGNQLGDKLGPAPILSASSTVEASPSVSLPPKLNSPRPTTTPTPTSSPKPGIKVDEVRDYNYWFSKLDRENKVIAIYEECAYLVPSNVTYKNNATIMLDNTRSKQDQVLKIGDKEYALPAGNWQIINLSASSVPAAFPIFCKGVEMGSIDLE